MARKRERFFAGFFAVLFLVTSSAIAVAFIVSLVQQHNQDKRLAEAAKTVCSTKPANNKENEHVNGQPLQGTQLANFNAGCQVPKLETIDTVPGTGEEAKPTDTVTVDYTGAVVSTGVIFQSSLDNGKPATFPLNQVIPGWTEGIPGLKVGGTRRLLIPANMAYGANPPQGSGIPANADLVFDVTLHKIGQ